MFTWDPAEYQDNSANQLQWGAELIALLKLTGREHVLDIGCGVGSITSMIAEQLPRGYVIGVDSSLEMVAQAHKNYPEIKNPNISFRVMDAGKLTFKNEFDAVFSNATLHWVKDHPPVLKGIYTAMHRGGRIVLQMGGRGNAIDILKTMNTITKRTQWSPYFKNFNFTYGFYGPEEYRSWLTQAGLQPVKIELVPKDMVHETKEKFAAWIRTTWLPYTQAVPQVLRETLIHEVVTEYIQNQPVDHGGFIHIKMSRLEVQAFKP